LDYEKFWDVCIMNIVQEDFHISTKSRNQMIDITSQVGSLVGNSGVTDGDVIVYCPHTTAAITINENADPSVPHDMLLTLEQLLPQHRSGYRHSEGNSDSHCKSSLVGCSEQILIKGGALLLGTWQGIFFCEFDGPRSRKVIVQVRGE
jgi:secondary thiamine-phosphate synthase enzyme